MYEEHKILQRLRKLIAVSDRSKESLPVSLAKKIDKLHEEMDELRLHAEKKCRKIMTPAAPFGPEVQHWYNRIHALKLMKSMILKPHRKHNSSNNFRFASHMMDHPRGYDLMQIIDGIRYCKLKQKEARMRAEPSREAMMRERLALAVEQRDKKKMTGIR